jgi:hypothetical protein
MPHRSALAASDREVAVPSAPKPDAGGLVEHARRLATPVDVRALVACGVLRPRRPRAWLWFGGWYEVVKPAALASHVRCQIAAMRAEAGVTLVRFRRRNTVAARLYAELTGAPPDA